MNYLLSTVDVGIDELAVISSRLCALKNYLVSTIDVGIDELPAISSRYIGH